MADRALEVGGSPGDATVTVKLHTERADGPGIRAGPEQTLAEIKIAVEGSSTSRAPRGAAGS
ncbi:MAG: hypothetical protein ABS81_16720 [Pseudonocardia sp. SCN 72-86]|nr:MAG: hypothetical protein ABS81_16720 [Pseudonocardia sp. SCN 72-86]